MYHQLFTIRMCLWSSGQDGGVGRNASFPHTTKRWITTNLKTINNQKCQKIKLHGIPTAKELKKCSPRPVGGAEMGDGHWSREGERQGSHEPVGPG